MSRSIAFALLVAGCGAGDEPSAAEDCAACSTSVASTDSSGATSSGADEASTSGAGASSASGAGGGSSTASGSGGSGRGGAAVFSSSWDSAAGTSADAVTDGGLWPNYWEFNGGSDIQLLSVVTDGPSGHNALRVQQRGSGYAANVQIDDVLPESGDYYLRFYVKNEDSSNAGDHIVTVDTWNYPNLTYLRKLGGVSSWTFVMSVYGCGYTYPIGHWTLAEGLANGQWYRVEYQVHYADATHVQVHPRVYDATGDLLFDDDDFQQSDFGSASWNGASNWTLSSYYAAGEAFCVDPSFTNDLGLGNNGQQGADDTGKYWYFAGVELRTDTWPGPIQ